MLAVAVAVVTVVHQVLVVLVEVVLVQQTRVFVQHLVKQTPVVAVEVDQVVLVMVDQEVVDLAL
tara:strand:+ start:515 stop:706 length:192 start_codon:yes stop_codon:yes gene_type:complete